MIAKKIRYCVVIFGIVLYSALQLVPFVSMASEMLLVEKAHVMVQRPNSSLRMFIPNDDGTTYVVGQDMITKHDWVSLVTSDGTSHWEVDISLPEYISGAVKVSDCLYVLVNQLGAPLAMRSPFLQPINHTGEKLNPINMPAWIADAEMLRASHGVFFYNRGNLEAPLFNVAMYDSDFHQTWEATVLTDETPVHVLTDVVEVDDGFVLSGNDESGRMAYFFKLNFRGQLMWKNTITKHGYVKAICSIDGGIASLFEKPYQSSDEFSYMILKVDQDGKVVQSQAIQKTKGLQLKDVLSTPNGIVLLGSRQYGHKPSEVVLVLLGKTLLSQSMLELPMLKDLVSQAIVVPDEHLIVFGVSSGNNGQGDGHILGITFREKEQ